MKEIAARLASARDSTDGSSVRWRSFTPYVLVPVLESVVDFQPGIPEADRRQLIHDAVHAAAVGVEFDASSLEKSLEMVEVQYLRMPLQRYVLATSWSVSPVLGMKQLRLGSAVVSPLSSRKTSYDRGPVQNRIEQIAPSAFSKMQEIRVSVPARTPTGAFELGKYAADYARGVRNYLLNRGTGAPVFNVGTQRPINRLLSGPIHTIHTDRGKLAIETVWYELYHPDQVLASSRLDRVEESAQRVHQRVKASAYSKDIQHGFVLINRALDNVDHSTAFMRLWAALEYLADTTEHERLVRRISFFASDADRELIDVVLRHMKHVRNGIVHGDTALKNTDLREGIEAHLYQLRVFAEWLLEFHFRKARTFISRSSAAEVLDTPTRKEELARVIKIYTAVLKSRQRK